MGFSVGNYAKIKSIVETKDSYTIAKLSFSKKNKNTNEYETNFIGVARFVGDAHRQRPMAEQRIKITGCDVTNCYIKDGKIEFPERPQYTVFAYELQDPAGGSMPTSIAQTATAVDDDDLPF